MEVVLTPEDREGYPIPGDIVVYTVNITNLGSLSLHDVTPDSSQVGPASCWNPVKDQRPCWTRFVCLSEQWHGQPVVC